MKEHRDAVAVPEEDPGNAAAAGTESLEDTRPMTESDPDFQVKKRDADGNWSAVSVSVTESAADERTVPLAQAYPGRNDPAEPEEEEQVSQYVPKKKKNLSFRMRRRGVGIAAAVVLVVIGAFSVYMYQYPSVFPGVHVASEFSVAGMSQEEAEAYISSECKDEVFRNDITVTGDGKEFTLHVGDVATGVDSKDSANAAYAVGREGGYFRRAGEILTAVFGRQNVPLSLELDEDAMQEFVDAVYEEVQYDPVQPSWKVSISEEQLTIDTGKTGLSFDSDKMHRDLCKRIGNMNFEPYEVETYVVDQEKPDAEEIAKDVCRDAENAKVDKETGEIIKAKSGIKVTAKEIKEVLGDATEQTYTVPVKLTKAKISGTKLERVLFRDVLASSTTYYNSGETGRTNNLTLAAQACDGVILNPGDEFSYNGEVGERTAERGYSTAIIFQNGAAVEDYGGGVCQPSSTIYMAVLRADLEVTERSSHYFQISYTPISQDAAVAWGSKDFRFKNNTDYPIKIDMSYGGGALTCTLYGTKVDDKEVSLYATSSVSGEYKYAELYKTVTVNGQSTTTHENSSAYSLKEH